MTESKNIPVSSGENKMGTMPVTKLILNMSLPMMFSMLIQALYNIVDSIFVARLGEDALTAVSLAFPIQNLMISLAVGTGVGINSLLSLRLGQKNQEDVDRTAMNGLFLAFCNTIAFIFVGVFAVEPYLRSQTTNEAIIQYGIDYLQIVTILGFGVFFEITFSRLLQSTGRTIYTMISQLVGAITNIIFDPLLIFGIGFFPELGMKGAAYATVLGQIFGMIVGLVCNIKRNPDINFKLKNIVPSGKIIAQIYKVGVPSILLTSVTSFTIYFVNLILGKFSSTAIAVYGIFFKLNSFVFMPVMGLNNGIVPIIAYNYGAKKRKRITNTIKSALFMAFCIMLFGTLAFEIFPKYLLLMFSASDEMLKIGIPALRTIAPSFLGAAVAITLSSVFQAFGSAIYSMIVSFSRQLLVFLPSAYLLSLTGNVNNVWFCFLIAEVMSLAMSLFFMKRIYRKKISQI